MIENYKELQDAINYKREVETYILKVKSIGYLGSFGSKNFIGISDHNNERYTFSGIENIIGKDKLWDIIKQFEGLINVELQKAKENAEKEVSKYQVIKKDK